MTAISPRSLLKRGFTLIELLIVIAVIGILAGGTITLLNPLNKIQKANDSKRKSDLYQIQHGLELFYQDHGYYPEANSFMIMNSNGTGPANWGTNQWSPYMSSLPIDPNSSRKRYIYNSIGGQSYCLYASLDTETLISSLGSCFPSGANCGDGVTCNYGVSSSNIDP